MSLPLFFLGSNLAAQTMAQEVEVTEGERLMSCRSVGFTPRASFLAETQELTISFVQAQNLYNVEILDESGVVVYSDILIANGQPHVYSLPGLSEGYFTMKISNTSKSYSGTFWL